VTDLVEVPGGSDREWTDGWWAHARAVRSPNFGPRPPDADIVLLVVHSISLPPGVYGGGEIEDLFLNRLDHDRHPYFDAIRGLTVSAHFVIDRTGGVTQFVSCNGRAWHAGPSSWQGRSNCNDYSIGVELEGLEGDTFEEPQYLALATLLQAVMRAYPLQGIAGHEHVAPGRKIDPGPGFDWPRLRSRIGEPGRALSWP